MAKSGDELIHPVTGERLVWRRVSRDTSGEFVEGDLFAIPGGHPAAAHVHPNQQERFGVLSGTIKLLVDGQESTIGVGEWAEVPVGPHRRSRPAPRGGAAGSALLLSPRRGTLSPAALRPSRVASV